MKIDEVEKELERLVTKRTEFSQEYKFFPIKIEKKYREVKGKDILSEIISKNLDTLRSEYNHAKEDFYSD